MKKNQITTSLDVRLPLGFLTMPDSWNALVAFLADSDYNLCSSDTPIIPAYTLWRKSETGYEKQFSVRYAYRSDFGHLQLHVVQFAPNIPVEKRYQWVVATKSPNAKLLTQGYCLSLKEARVCAQIARQIIAQVIVTTDQIEQSRSRFCSIE